MDMFLDGTVSKLRRGFKDKKLLCPYCNRENSVEELRRDMEMEGYYYSYINHLCSSCEGTWCSIYRYRDVEAVNATAPLSSEAKERYFEDTLESRMRCPGCGEYGHIELDEMEHKIFDFDTVNFRFFCDSCGCNWQDVHEYVLSVMEVPDDMDEWPWDDLPFLEAIDDIKLSYLFNE